jgi:hypothetical protein
MNIKKTTKIATISLIGLILIYDIYAYVKGGQEATISYLIITDWSKNYSAFTFGIGFVMGHLFWPLAERKK